MDIAGVYQHYKGKKYLVIKKAVDIATGEVFVYYKQLYEPYKYWIRPWKMFFGEIQLDGTKRKRFLRLDSVQPICEKMEDVSVVVHSETLMPYELVEEHPEEVLVRQKAAQDWDIKRGGIENAV